MPDRITIDYNSLKSLVMQAPVSFMLLEGDNLVIRLVNQRVLEYTGKLYDDMIDRPFFEVFKELRNGYYEIAIKNIISTGETFRANELPLRLKEWDAGQRYINIILKPYYDNDKIMGIIGTASDVTELVNSRNAARESEDKFKAIFNTMDQGLAIVEMEYDKSGKAFDYKFVEINRTFEQESGLPNVLGKKASELLREHAPYWIDIFAKVRASGETVRLAANRTVSGRWFETNVFPVGGDGSRKVAFIFSDIHERKEEEFTKERFSKELQKEVEVRTAELNRSNRELLQFARAASHDLKEPVRKIRTFSTILLDEFENTLPQRAIGFLKKIIKSSDRLRKMMESMRNYISLEKPINEFAPVDLNQIVNNVLIGMEMLIENKNTNFTINPLPVIEGSGQMLHLLFQNIIENSIKFSYKDRPVELFIGSSPIIINGKDYVEIEIADTGIGFSPEFSRRIFESFVRLNSGDDYNGVGMGLAIVKQVVERHAGFIVASGKEGLGASFKIQLPITQNN